MFFALPAPLKLFLLPIILLLGFDPDAPTQSPPLSHLTFELRHQHAVSADSEILFMDVPPSLISAEYTLDVRKISTHRPSFNRSVSRIRHSSLTNNAFTWDEVEVPGPDIESRETLLQLAKMTNNAYYDPSDKSWYSLGTSWNSSFPFGWEPDADGFRGHLFVSNDNSTVVLSIKGTSAGWIAGDGGPTVSKDKFNDNLLFSCCCARVGPTWSPVCGCYSGNFKCDTNCLEKALTDDSLFYNVATNLYYNVTYMYPDANLWIIGHSLGGSLASLLGATFGAPVVAFEAPGEKLAASRLHLPLAPSTHHITHVYNTGDPIATGKCTGLASTCALWGYAMETHCHLGKVIEYDTVTKLNWAVNIKHHGVRVVIEQMLSEDWEPPLDGGVGRQVPAAVVQEDCVECHEWEFGEYKDIREL